MAAFVVGVIVAALQSAMRMPDMTLTFVPKIAAALTAVVLLGMGVESLPCLPDSKRALVARVAYGLVCLPPSVEPVEPVLRLVPSPAERPIVSFPGIIYPVRAVVAVVAFSES